MSQRWRSAPKGGSPHFSWRRCRCRAETTSPASSRASPGTTATSSTTWPRRSWRASPNKSAASCCRPLSWTGSAAHCAMPSPARTAAGQCWRLWIGETSSWSRPMTAASSIANTLSLRTQHVRKEMVVAILLAAVIERDQEEVSPIQSLQHCPAAVLAGDGIAQWAAEPVQDRGLQQEAADLFGLAPVSYTHLTLPTNREV